MRHVAPRRAEQRPAVVVEVEPVDVDQLFIHTLRDLERRTAATDEYEVLLSAALLRKLLLDQERLMDQVNRRYSLDLRFRISDVSPFEQKIWDSTPTFWALEGRQHRWTD